MWIEVGSEVVTRSRIAPKSQIGAISVKLVMIFGEFNIFLVVVLLVHDIVKEPGCRLARGVLVTEILVLLLDNVVLSRKYMVKLRKSSKKTIF